MYILLKFFCVSFVVVYYIVYCYIFVPPLFDDSVIVEKYVIVKKLHWCKGHGDGIEKKNVNKN